MEMMKVERMDPERVEKLENLLADVMAVMLEFEEEIKLDDWLVMMKAGKLDFELAV